MNARLTALVIGALLASPLAYAVGGPPMQEVQFPYTWLADVPGNDVLVMWAELEVMDEAVKGAGKLKSHTWYAPNGELTRSFKTVINVGIPSKLPAFATLADAMDADVRIRITGEGVPYAECMLTLEPVTARSYVTFTLDLVAVGDDVKPVKGVCDINLEETGIQVGIPELHYLDLITTYVKGKPYDETEFLRGYCQ